MMDANRPDATPAAPQPLAPEDYYIEDGYLVFTAAYHLKRGYCCGSGCRHCPYREQAPTDQSPEPADAPDAPAEG